MERKKIIVGGKKKRQFENRTAFLVPNTNVLLDNFIYIHVY